MQEREYLPDARKALDRFMIRFRTQVERRAEDFADADKRPVSPVDIERAIDELFRDYVALIMDKAYSVAKQEADHVQDHQGLAPSGDG